MSQGLHESSSERPARYPLYKTPHDRHMQSPRSGSHEYRACRHTRRRRQSRHHSGVSLVVVTDLATERTNRGTILHGYQIRFEKHLYIAAYNSSSPCILLNTRKSVLSCQGGAQFASNTCDHGRASQECRTSKYPVPSSAVRNVARHSTPCHPLQWRHGHPSADLHTPGPADPAHRTHVQGRKLAAMARSRMRIEDWRSRNEYHSRGAQHIHGSCVYTSILRNSDTTSTPSFIQ